MKEINIEWQCTNTLTLSGMTLESKKNAHLQSLKGSMSWAGCQNNPIEVNFHLKKNLEIFDKK